MYPIHPQHANQGKNDDNRLEGDKERCEEVEINVVYILKTNLKLHELLICIEGVLLDEELL